jgi:hypothetical protein
MTRKKLTKAEAHALHEQIALDNFAAYELSDSHNFEDRQKTRNILRYQTRGYCFELPPRCSRWGIHCSTCSYLKCRDNEQYDKEKWNGEYDSDVDRFSSFAANLHVLAMHPHAEVLAVQNSPPQVDVSRSLNSLLASLAERSKSAVA